MTLNFRLIIRRDIWIFHSKVFSSDDLIWPKMTSKNENDGFMHIIRIMHIVRGHQKVED